MADLTPQEMAAKLRGERFKPSGSELTQLSDPIADTAMVITLDQLRPYDLNPRIVRNPRYDDIKASMRERGLEAPPPITKRPGEAHYIIRNGGNTRLSILNELWAETKDERFFRIPCLFRPWSARGEILVLTGHLAENELRGALSFIERALGVDKARELYEQEAGKTLTQTELSKRLTQDGYPVAQSHISRMQDAIRYLLPSIPKILFSGLGKHQIERLITLRRSAERIFDRHSNKKPLSIDFEALFHDVSSAFDLAPAAFNAQRLQDELIGQMASLLGADYDALSLELEDAETLLQSWTRETTATAPATSPTPIPATSPAAASPPQSAQTSDGVPQAGVDRPGRDPTGKVVVVEREATAPARPVSATMPTSHAQTSEDVQGPIAVPAKATDRVQAIQQQIARATSDSASPREVEASVPREQVAHLDRPQPDSDIWSVDPSIDKPARLRALIGQLACDIAREANVSAFVTAIDEGVGFVCHDRACSLSSGDATPTGDAMRARAALSLLSALSSGYVAGRSAIDGVRLMDDLAPLLQGMWLPGQRSFSSGTRLSDEGMIRLFRLIRLARRLVDHESAASGTADPSHGRQ